MSQLNKKCSCVEQTKTHGEDNDELVHSAVPVSQFQSKNDSSVPDKSQHSQVKPSDKAATDYANKLDRQYIPLRNNLSGKVAFIPFVSWDDLEYLKHKGLATMPKADARKDPDKAAAKSTRLDEAVTSSSKPATNPKFLPGSRHELEVRHVEDPAKTLVVHTSPVSHLPHFLPPHLHEKQLSARLREGQETSTVKSAAGAHATLPNQNKSELLRQKKSTESKDHPHKPSSDEEDAKLKQKQSQKVIAENEKNSAMATEVSPAVKITTEDVSPLVKITTKEIAVERTDHAKYVAIQKTERQQDMKVAVRKEVVVEVSVGLPIRPGYPSRPGYGLYEEKPEKEKPGSEPESPKDEEQRTDQTQRKEPLEVDSKSHPNERQQLMTDTRFPLSSGVSEQGAPPVPPAPPARKTDVPTRPETIRSKDDVPVKSKPTASNEEADGKDAPGWFSFNFFNRNSEGIHGTSQTPLKPAEEREKPQVPSRAPDHQEISTSATANDSNWLPSVIAHAFVSTPAKLPQDTKVLPKADASEQKSRPPDKDIKVSKLKASSEKQSVESPSDFGCLPSAVTSLFQPTENITESPAKFGEPKPERENPDEDCECKPKTQDPHGKGGHTTQRRVPKLTFENLPPSEKSEPESSRPRSPAPYDSSWIPSVIAHAFVSAPAKPAQETEVLPKADASEQKSKPHDKDIKLAKLHARPEKQSDESPSDLGWLPSAVTSLFQPTENVTEPATKSDKPKPEHPDEECECKPRTMEHHGKGGKKEPASSRERSPVPHDSNWLPSVIAHAFVSPPGKPAQEAEVLPNADGSEQKSRPPGEDIKLSKLKASSEEQSDENFSDLGWLPSAVTSLFQPTCEHIPESPAKSDEPKSGSKEPHGNREESTLQRVPYPTSENVPSGGNSEPASSRGRSRSDPEWLPSAMTSLFVPSAENITEIPPKSKQEKSPGRKDKPEQKGHYVEDPKKPTHPSKGKPTVEDVNQPSSGLISTLTDLFTPIPRISPDEISKTSKSEETKTKESRDDPKAKPGVKGSEPDKGKSRKLGNVNNDDDDDDNNDSPSILTQLFDALQTSTSAEQETNPEHDSKKHDIKVVTPVSSAVFAMSKPTYERASLHDRFIIPRTEKTSQPMKSSKAEEEDDPPLLHERILQNFIDFREILSPAAPAPEPPPKKQDQKTISLKDNGSDLTASAQPTTRGENESSKMQGFMSLSFRIPTVVLALILTVASSYILYPRSTFKLLGMSTRTSFTHLVSCMMLVCGFLASSYLWFSGRFASWMKTLSAVHPIFEPSPEMLKELPENKTEKLPEVGRRDWFSIGIWYPLLLWLSTFTVLNVLLQDKDQGSAVSEVLTFFHLPLPQPEGRSYLLQTFTVASVLGICAAGKFVPRLENVSKFARESLINLGFTLAAMSTIFLLLWDPLLFATYGRYSTKPVVSVCFKNCYGWYLSMGLIPALVYGSSAEWQIPLVPKVLRYLSEISGSAIALLTGAFLLEYLTHSGFVEERFACGSDCLYCGTSNAIPDIVPCFLRHKSELTPVFPLFSHLRLLILTAMGSLLLASTVKEFYKENTEKNMWTAWALSFVVTTSIALFASPTFMET